jgi:hypothetical protein
VIGLADIARVSDPHGGGEREPRLPPGTGHYPMGSLPVQQRPCNQALGLRDTSLQDEAARRYDGGAETREPLFSRIDAYYH